jgi:hypothetical protein
MLCVERALFEKVGGFDESYWYGYEDVDLCLKIRSRGRKIIYSPGMTAVHHESATLRESRDSVTFRKNYERYRQRWNAVLEAGEKAFIRRMHEDGIKRVLVFGTGLAAQGLFRILEENRISVIGFACSPGQAHGEELLDRPIIPLERLDLTSFDSLLIGTQYFFEIEALLHSYLPPENIIFPIVKTCGKPVDNTCGTLLVDTHGSGK